MRSLIAVFAGHRVAPNLLMLLMIISGFFVLGRLEIRFFPEFSEQTIQVTVPWPGASAANVNESLLTPLENELRNISDIKEMQSFATDGVGIVYLQFPDNIELEDAMDEVRRYLDLAKASLPADSEEPETKNLVFDDEIMRLSLTGHSLKDIRKIARQIENELLALGDIRIDVSGLYEEAIEIRLQKQRLSELDLTPSEIGQQIRAQNLNVTAGDIDSSGAVSRLIRSLSKKEKISELSDILILNKAGNVIRLGDIADLQRVPRADVTEITFNGQPAVQFNITRRSGGNAIEGGNKVNEWLRQKQQILPTGFKLHPHKEEWRLIESRLNLLIVNGAQGLIIVLIFLFLFLNWRLAFWIGMGIPTVFMVSLGVLYLLGGSIDMLTLFAFIMTMGIVVDDAIVVGENAIYHLQQGKPPMQSAVDGAHEMFSSVFSSTFTTISSFMPLMIVGGPIGSILFVIPLVVICVLLSALFECFVVLPGHLAGSFKKINQKKDRPPLIPIRQSIDKAFEWFQETVFRRVVILVLRYRWVTIFSSFVMLLLSITLFIGGQVKFRFFPGAELNRIQVQARFIAGTPRSVVEAYVQDLEQSMHQVMAEYEEEVLLYYSTYLGRGALLDGITVDGFGDEIASMYVELTEGDKRQAKIDDIVKKWNDTAPRSVYLENLIIRAESGGPPGEDLQVQFIGDNPQILKEVANSFKTSLLNIPGVSRPKDDIPLGKKQLIFDLTPQGHALNLSINDIATQIRHAFDGYEVQTFYQGVDEVEVLVKLDYKDIVEGLTGFNVRLPNGKTALLSDVVNLSNAQGYDRIQKINGSLIVNVSGDIDFSETDVATVIRQLNADVLPQIVNQYGVRYSYAGAQKDEKETFQDMVTGLMIAGLLIFVILCAVFSSWTLPVVIILTAPLGIIGAIIGHWIMDEEMSILSMFGIFTLSGIVINDSIVLVRDYLNRQIKSGLEDSQRHIVDSVCRRFRAILLTTLTTIGGLIPLMFETSTQAKFLIPMAISICFGLAFASLLILFVMPSYLSVHASFTTFFKKILK